MGDNLNQIYTRYCHFGAGQHKRDTLDNPKFFKLINECGLIDNKLSRASVDICFQKVMKKERKMNFEQFQEALKLIAKTKNISLDEVLNAITTFDGPKLNNITQFADDEWVKKQTDARNYTGMHKYRFDLEGKGLGIAGRKYEEEQQGGLENLLDRSEADLRGRKKEDVVRRNQEEELKEEIVQTRVLRPPRDENA